MQIDQLLADADVDRSDPRWRLGLSRPQQATFDDSKTYYVTIETDHGEIRIRLLPETAPMHVTSFLYLTRLGFYDGLTFHRVIPGFMAQGGCPMGSGTGDPGYKFDGEFDPSVKHDRPYLLSMANAGPGTDGSQFFLTFVPTPWLDGNHTIFGEIVDGESTMKALEDRGTQHGAPTEELRMERVRIEIE
jgi:cyclophilin family peptidyl-prolyl cis-trans isomerase